jgi:hypothetical protein
MLWHITSISPRKNTDKADFVLNVAVRTVCCDLLSINKYYTILNYKYLLLENAYMYLACILLKIMNNINVDIYDNKLTVPGDL